MIWQCTGRGLLQRSVGFLSPKPRKAGTSFMRWCGDCVRCESSQSFPCQGNKGPHLLIPATGSRWKKFLCYRMGTSQHLHLPENIPQWASFHKHSQKPYRLLPRIHTSRNLPIIEELRGVGSLASTPAIPPAFNISGGSIVAGRVVTQPLSLWLRHGLKAGVSPIELGLCYRNFRTLSTHSSYQASLAACLFFSKSSLSKPITP